MLLALSLFLYFFFIIPWTPVYEENFTLRPTRNYILDDNGRKIIGWQYPAIVLLAPIIFCIGLIFMLIDVPKIRPVLKESKKKLKNYIKWKIDQDRQQKHDWIFGENKK